jgi:AcrR family transcriptional regulator
MTRPLPVAPDAPARPAGDLRARILAASLDLLETEGLAALSMREVARRAGVTHQAPYHHFADRESILAELVGDGFIELTRRLERANDRAATLGVRAALIEAGEAYVGFALEHPGVFRIMFRPEVCDVGRFPAAHDAGHRAYAALGRLVRIVHGRDDEALASMHWAQVHGLACLLLDGGLGDALPGARERRAHVHETLGRFADYVVGTA